MCMLNKSCCRSLESLAQELNGRRKTEYHGKSMLKKLPQLEQIFSPSREDQAFQFFMELHVPLDRNDTALLTELVGKISVIRATMWTVLGLCLLVGIELRSSDTERSSCMCVSVHDKETNVPLSVLFYESGNHEWHFTIVLPMCNDSLFHISLHSKWSLKASSKQNNKSPFKKLPSFRSFRQTRESFLSQQNCVLFFQKKCVWQWQFQAEF